MLWKLAAIAALAACAVALPISGFFAEFEHAVEAQFKCELIWPISLSLHLYVSDVCVAISLPPSLQFHGSTLQLDVMRHFIRAISPPRRRHCTIQRCHRGTAFLSAFSRQI